MEIAKFKENGNFFIYRCINDRTDLDLATYAYYNSHIKINWYLYLYFCNPEDAIAYHIREAFEIVSEIYQLIGNISSWLGNNLSFLT